jgi:CDP-diacylglycerol--serine O-phosphatidyltransferase
MKKNLANYITLGNLLCGLLALQRLSLGDAQAPFYAFALIGLAAVLDFFDGFTARWLGADGEMGKQLDSLADLVSFGVVPGMIWQHYMLELGYCSSSGFCINQYLWVLIPLGAAWRLARFNVQEVKGYHFVGVPTPIMGLALASWSALHEGLAHPGAGAVLDIYWLQPLDHFYIWLYMPLVAFYLMIGDMPMMAFKGKPSVWHWVFLGISASAVGLLGLGAGPLILLSYLVCSVLANFASASQSAKS